MAKTKSKEAAEVTPLHLKDEFTPPETAPEGSIHTNSITKIRHRRINGEWVEIQGAK
jgi:hypothetical protein